MLRHCRCLPQMSRFVCSLSGAAVSLDTKRLSEPEWSQTPVFWLKVASMARRAG
jgi:hypothetical protein